MESRITIDYTGHIKEYENKYGLWNYGLWMKQRLCAST